MDYTALIRSVIAQFPGAELCSIPCLPSEPYGVWHKDLTTMRVIHDALLDTVPETFRVVLTLYGMVLVEPIPQPYKP